MLPRAWARAACLIPLLLPLPTALTAQAAMPASTSSAGPSIVVAMQAAAQAHHVPLQLIEAVAFVNTRWEWIPTPAQNGGVGPMNIRPSQLTEAASQSGDSPSQISGNLSSNLDAGAALLAHYHGSGSDLSSWYGAVTTVFGAYVASEIYDTLRTGAGRTTSTGETITLAPQTVTYTGSAKVGGASPATTDYPGATWVPADPSNYSVANRTHDYPVDMIIIHDIEGSYGSGIQDFQTPGFVASANYVVSYRGQVTQMVLEKDIAWHAGNWDYNTRAIGIEHEGFAYFSGLYTTAEYDASAALAASICSRYGVPMDRAHVIGHYQVPDPNNPGLYGGVDHHTDPGPYWDWTYYMGAAQADAKKLPSPPHLMPDPVAVNGLNSVTVSWTPARTCRPADAPITGYTVVGQPGSITMNVPATATTATFAALQQGTTYTFTVTAHNSYGDDSQISNHATPGRCTNTGVSAAPRSPQPSATKVVLTATSSSCPNPLYEFWILAPGASLYTLAQGYSSNAVLNWNTVGLTPGSYLIDVWAKDASSPGTYSNPWGSWDDYNASDSYSLIVTPCTAVSESASPPGAAMTGMPVSLSAQAAGCANPSYEFWILAPGASLYTLAQAYSTSATYSWNTSGLVSGTYRVNVWVRDASSQGVYGNSSGRWDAYNAGLTYNLTAGCVLVSDSAAPAAAAMSGMPVAVSASAPACPNPEYEFWVLRPGANLYTLGQPYGASPTFNWSTSGLAAGTYRITVWVRDASSSGVYGNSSGRWDAYNANLLYALTAGCPSVGESASTTSATVGSPVTITAISPACPGPQYEFWILYPGASLYTLAQAYGSSPNLIWPTTGLPKGTYRVNVWVRDASSAGTYGNSWGRWDAYNASLLITLR